MRSMRRSGRRRVGFGAALVVSLLLLAGCPIDPATAPVGTNKFYKALDFTLNDATETPHSLSDYRGKVVWLQFLNPTDCPACILEAEASEAFYQKYKEQGFVIITVLIGSEANAALCEAFAAEHGLSFPVLYNKSPDDAWVDYNTYTSLWWLQVPLNLVIDRDGIIRYKSEKNDGYPDDAIENVVIHWLD